MDAIEEIKLEHEKIERELIELDTIMQSAVINYPNLVHVFKQLSEIWEKHEIKEEEIFPILEKEGIAVPVDTILWEHKKLRSHRQAVLKAINSGSEPKLKQALKNSGKIIINQLKQHMESEENIFYSLPISKEIHDKINQAMAHN